jgi:hypothetical protein
MFAGVGSHTAEKIFANMVTALRLDREPSAKLSAARALLDQPGAAVAPMVQPAHRQPGGGSTSRRSMLARNGGSTGPLPCDS